MYNYFMYNEFNLSMSSKMEMQRVQPLNYSKKAVFDIAKMTAETLKFSPGDDVKAVISSLGGQIEYTEASIEEEPDSIKIEAKNKFTIFISVFTSSLRDNFTIAHELGHYILHYLLGKNGKGKVSATRALSDNPVLNRTEFEANWFAAGFLMPEEEFKKQWGDCGYDIDQMSAYFKVSASAIRVRLQDLNLICNNK